MSLPSEIVDVFYVKYCNNTACFSSYGNILSEVTLPKAEQTIHRVRFCHARYFIPSDINTQ